ncbi:MAG: UDP-glucose 4-epimerase-like protein [Phycisphaerae bacterium]|nr:MAG: UDP-glucose 4-epimerase-like protein [Phycisphaerae bacterium]
MTSTVDYQGYYAGVPVLVTGGAGFIGSHLASRLLELGARVRIVDDLSSGFAANVPAGAALTRASVLDDTALRDAMRGCRVVFHQAALVSVPQSIEQPERCLEANILGTQRVLLAARDLGVSRVLFAASAAAYGNTPTLPSRETDRPDTWSPYAASKVTGEYLLQTFARCYGLSTLSLRYFNIFGPRQDPRSPYAAVISAFADALLNGKNPRVFGDGLQTRDFTYIDNVVHANLLGGSSSTDFQGDVINIGTGIRTSLLDVLEHMAREFGMEPHRVYEPARAGDIRDSVADIGLARSRLQYEPLVGFAEGIRRTLAWFRGTTAPSR